MNVLEALRGGDLRSIGQSNTAVRYVLRQPTAVAELAPGLPHDDPVMLTEMAADDVPLLRKIAQMLERAPRSPIASTRARAGKLLRDVPRSAVGDRRSV